MLLTPLYDEVPLKIHKSALYILFAIGPGLIYYSITRDRDPREAVSGRVCIAVTVLAGDVCGVSGRRLGSLAATLLGPKWGGLISRLTLGMGVVGGGTWFALLCFVGLLHYHEETTDEISC